MVCRSNTRTVIGFKLKYLPMQASVIPVTIMMTRAASLAMVKTVCTREAIRTLKTLIAVRVTTTLEQWWLDDKDKITNLHYMKGYRTDSDRGGDDSHISLFLWRGGLFNRIHSFKMTDRWCTDFKIQTWQGRDAYREIMPRKYLKRSRELGLQRKFEDHKNPQGYKGGIFNND